MIQEGKKLTMDDVAKELGVSKTTVSRAVSGKGRIGEQTRQRVLEYISQHNYKPNVMAKGLANQRTYNIGMVLQADLLSSDLPFFPKAPQEESLPSFQEPDEPCKGRSAPKAPVRKGAFQVPDGARPAPPSPKPRFRKKAGLNPESWAPSGSDVPVSPGAPPHGAPPEAHGA